MGDNLFTFLVGGKAGEGIKKTGAVAASLFSRMGRHTFRMNDYQSLIRGGHNFTVVSSATGPVTSHHMKADMVVALDRRSYDAHVSHLKEGGVFVYNSDTVDGARGIGLPLTSQAKKYPNPGLRLGVGAVTALGVSVGLRKSDLKRMIAEEYKREIEENTAYSMAIYDIAQETMFGRFKLKQGENRLPMLSGNEAIAMGSLAGGLDVYYAYPMTPTSGILHFLAAHGEELGVVALQPESEIAVINMAIGSTFAGARTMVGTSGGGFALMEEGFSLAGMAEAPVLCILGSRPGPSTGLATYTEQCDLGFALNQGHGEFPRIVASPGTIEEAFHLSSQMLDLVWRFQTPGIILTEKHLTESVMSVDIDIENAGEPEYPEEVREPYRRYLETDTGVSPLLFPPSSHVIKWNSNEHDEMGITTEEPALAVSMHEKRRRKGETLVDHLRNMRVVNKFVEGDPLVFTYGSTTMSVLEAIRTAGINATVVQPIYLEPFPVWEIEQYRGRRAVVVEQSSVGQFTSLLRDKAGIESEATIKRFDGRPFDPGELGDEMKKVLGNG